MISSVLIDLLAATAAIATPQNQDCRAITDPAARLACYDSRDRSAASAAPAAGVPAAAPSYAPPAAVAARPPEAREMSNAEVIRSNPNGRVASVQPLKYGLYRLTLADGRVLETATNTQRPPEVGTAVGLRRTLIGTTFLDAPGRDPITVRLVRRYR
jgi:hypothetical protein